MSELVFQLLWRRGAAPRRADIVAFRSHGGRAKAYTACPCQPGPYWALDLGPLLLVAIDTGVTGELDAEQGEWLRTVSMLQQDKLLLTGKPLYVDQRRAPGDIDTPDLEGPTGVPLFADLAAAPRTVEEIVRNPAHRYRAVVGGDIHNYQRYSVLYANGSPEHLHAIVSGGGGAYLTNTHRVPFWPPKAGDADDPSFADIADLKTLYPKREQSLRLYVGPAHRVLWVMTMGLLLLLLGGVGTAVVLWLAEATTHTAATALWIEAAILGIALALLVWLPRRLKALRLFIDFAVLGISPLLGSLLPLSARWLIPGRFKEACLIGVAILVWAAIPTVLDRRFDRRPPWLKVLWRVVILTSMGGCLVAIQHWGHRGSGFQAAAGIAAILVVPPALVFASRKAVDWKQGWITPLLPLAFVAGLVCWYVFLSVDALFGQLTILGLAVWLVGTTLLASHLGQRLRKFPAFLYTSSFVVASAWIAYPVYVHVDQRYPRLAVALLVASILIAAGATLLYLLWLRGMQNLCWWPGLQRYQSFKNWQQQASWRRRCEHLGMVPIPFPSFLADRYKLEDVRSEAANYLTAREKLVAARSSRPNADEGAMLDVSERVRRCFDTLMPRPVKGGTGDETAKRSPLSLLVSELFDPHEPPFYKNFLRCDLEKDGDGAWDLAIRAYGVEGDEPPDGEPPHAELIDGPLHITLV